MLQARGMKPGEDSTAFALNNPQVIEEVQRMYVDAGSDIIYAPTFNLSRNKLAELGETADSIIEKLSAPSRKIRDELKAGGRQLRVALDIGPQGEMLEPIGNLSFEDAYDFYAEQVRAGVKAGLDLVVIETITDLQDARAALLAAKENSDLPVFVTMSFEVNGRTFVGTTIESMAMTLEGLGADAIGINCSLGPAQILPLIKRLMASTSLPVIAKPNAGLPDPATGGYDIDCDQFVELMKDYIKAGVSYVGGCCGTNPDYIRGVAEYAALADKAASVEAAGAENSLATPKVCSAGKVVTVDHVTVIGERLNPTGKKKLKQALIDEDYDYILLQAMKQIDAGAEILDVNVGVPGLDEAVAMPKVVKKLQSVTNVPLQIDSSDPAAVEAALRVYNGKAIVNSVNGEEAVMDRLLPIVKKYGAAVIGLTLDDKGIPATCEERFAIAERILNKALSYGIPKEDLIIDCLTLTVSAQQKEVDETLKTVKMVHDKLGLRTALGVSNVSFGLPLRGIINSTFLTMAMENGLDLPIINPNDEDMMASIFAFNVLKNRDVNSVAYIERYAGREMSSKIGEKKEKAADKAETPDNPIYYGVERGLEKETALAVEKLLETKKPMDIVNQDLIPALDKVGKGFERGDIFLPEMVQSAQAAQAGFDVIKRVLDESGERGEAAGKAIIATVKGDIHDIGKNIVKVIMENYGYEMIDLGKDVAPETIVAEMKVRDIKLVGLSALMTTSLQSMQETIEAIKSEAPDCRVMVGGAVLTADYAREIGADYYCSDAMKSVEAAQDTFGRE